MKVEAVVKITWKLPNGEKIIRTEEEIRSMIQQALKAELDATETEIQSLNISDEG